MKKTLLFAGIFWGALLLSGAENSWPLSELEKVRSQRSLWENNSIGKSSKVMRPWIPLTYQDGRLRSLVWNISCGGTLLPNRIWNEKYELFAAAPFLAVTTSEGKIIFRKGDVKLLKKSDTCVTLLSCAEQKGVKVSFLFEYEFDGMAKVTMSLNKSSRPVKVRKIELVFPMRKEFSDYYHYFISGHHPIRPFNASGATPARGITLDTFRNQIWLGSPEAGFSFFAEGMMNWPLKNEKAIQKVSPLQKGRRELTVTLGNREFLLDKELKVVFGLQPTPAKYREYDFRRRSDMSTLTWPWQRWGDGAAHPFDDSEEAKKYIEKCRKAGKELMPYSSTHYYGLYRYGWNMFGKIKKFPGLIHPELKLWGPEWARKVQKGATHLKAWKPVAGRNYIDTALASDDMSKEPWQNKMYKPTGLVELCPRSGFQDYYLWRLKNTVDKTSLKTIYLDSGTNSCGNKRHGCGYKDYKGQWRESAPFFSAREMVKRMRQIFYDRFGETRICLHVSCHLETPFLSFVDTHLSAEQYAYEPFSVKEFYSELLTGDIMLAEHTGIPFGVAGEFLPVFNFFWRDYRAPSPASIRDLCGFAFIHDVNPSPKDTRFNDLISFYQKKRLSFFPRCDRVARYWEKNLPFAIEPSQVKGILHWSDNELLFIIFNWSSKAVNARVTLDPRRMKNFKGTFSLKELINEELFEEKNGVYTIPVAPRDFRMFKGVRKK